MARTSRNGAPSANAVDALDNLNLDDMFADDALFDGLDIDLGTMDDITGGAGTPKNAAAAMGRGGAAATILPPLTQTTSITGSPSRSQSSKQSVPPSGDQASAEGSPGAAGADSPTATRRGVRKTKRKIKSPFLFEDDDDEYVDEPSKKKRKGSKPGPKKKVGRKPASAMAGAVADDIKGNAVVATAASGMATVRGKAAKGQQRSSSSSMPPPAAREATNNTALAAATTTGPSSNVAAPGQFGSRQKRGNSFALPTKANKIKPDSRLPDQPNKIVKSKTAPLATPPLLVPLPTSSAPPPSTPATLSSTALNLSQVQATHPGLTQSSFCGLLPSNTLFYPFMPTLPPEPSLKNRKVYALLDRIHSAFMSHLQVTGKNSASDFAGVVPAKDSEPMVKLMQEALKEPSAGVSSAVVNRQESVGSAVAAVRRTISSFDTARLAGDLYAVCALLRRQHDFLKQNVANMQRWCKDNFNDEDYTSVFENIKSQRKRKLSETTSTVPTVPWQSVLIGLAKGNFKVKLICSGFKTKAKDPLLATLTVPMPPVPSVVAEAPKSASERPAKKKKVAPVLEGREHVTAAPVSVTYPVVAAAVETRDTSESYANSAPWRRRKLVAELLVQTAKELEASYLRGIDDRRIISNRQENEIRQCLADDEINVVQTTAMWKWFETSGFFASNSAADIRQRLDSVRSPNVGTAIRIQRKSVSRKVSSSADGSILDRLQSLLVSEDDDENDVDDENNYEDFECKDDQQEGPLADISSLTLDERSYVQLRRLGLLDGALPWFEGKEDGVRLTNGLETYNPAQANDASGKESSSRRQVGLKSDLECLIESMIADLKCTSRLNNRRVALLELAAKAGSVSAEESKRQNEDEAVLISRYQLILKRSKELKAKNAKAKDTKNDDLPW